MKTLPKTAIPYATHHWSFQVGCTHSGSPGCDNCWARTLHDQRHRAYLNGADLPAMYAKPFDEIQIFKDRVEPRLPKEPSIIFCLPQSDMFHGRGMLCAFGTVFDAAKGFGAPHTWLVLTKRPQWLPKGLRAQANLWVGVSVSTQADADKHIPTLIRKWPGPKWVSIEPMLGPIVIEDWLPELDWVIVGGESGRSARPMEPCWAAFVCDDCLLAHVPYYFKQRSSNPGEGRVKLWDRGLYSFEQAKEFPTSFPQAAVDKLGGTQL